MVLGVITFYAVILYNASGRLTAVYDNGTLKTSYTYDLLGQLLTTTNANSTTETNAYNSAGLEYTYDGCGQLIKTVLGNRTTPADKTSFANASAVTVDTPTGVSIKATYQIVKSCSLLIASDD